MSKQCQPQVSHGDKNEAARSPFLKLYSPVVSFLMYGKQNHHEEKEREREREGRKEKRKQVT